MIHAKQTSFKRSLNQPFSSQLVSSSYSSKDSTTFAVLVLFARFGGEHILWRILRLGGAQVIISITVVCFKKALSRTIVFKNASVYRAA
jgi:hypothetical protein